MTTLIMGIILLLAGILLKFYPQLLSTLSEKDKSKMDKKRLSNFLLISFCSLGIFLIILNYSSKNAMIMSFPIVILGAIFIAGFSTRYIKK